MNETFMRTMLSWKLELITQRPNAFLSWVTSLDGAEVLVNPFLVLCLTVFADEDLQSKVLMISEFFWSDSWQMKGKTAYARSRQSQAVETDP